MKPCTGCEHLVAVADNKNISYKCLRSIPGSNTVQNSGGRPMHSVCPLRPVNLNDTSQKPTIAQ